MRECDECERDLSKLETVVLYMPLGYGKTEAGYTTPTFCSSYCCEQYILKGRTLRIPIQDKYPNLNAWDENLNTD